LALLFDGGIVRYKDGELGIIRTLNTDVEALETFTSAKPGQSYIPLIGTNTKTLQIAIIAGAEGDYAIGVVSLDALSATEILTSLHSTEHTAIYILDAASTVLYHNNSSMIGRRFSQDNPDGIIQISAPIEHTGWVLVQEEDWQEELSPLMRYSQAAPLVLIPGLLLVLLLIWSGIRQIVRPLQRLEAQATSLDWGNFAAIEYPVGGIEEIQRLQATLRNMVQRIQAAQAGMHNYIGAVTRAQEDERLRLARELHDQTAQALVALNHQVQMLKPFLADDAEAAALMSETRSNISQSIEDLRRIVRALRPVSLEQLGLAPALQMLARDLDLGDQVIIHFEKQGIPRRLSSEEEIVLYRIAQEALNNAWQHSGAKHIWLMVEFTETYITVSVRDDGHGFPAPQHPSDLTRSEGRHFGIMGMYERAALIGAHLHLQSIVDGGTTVTIRLPVEAPIPQAT
ncbi:MAG: hypothetical protein K8I82_11855, partial [Anaerolineae bacterium]|nr:hypothetical protein [Anaerolineae bacterium]